MTKFEEKIMMELKKRFENENNITLNMKKSGNKVFIGRQTDDNDDLFDITSDVQDGTIPFEATSHFLFGFENLAKYIAAYDDEMDRIRKNLRELDEYRSQFIDGHTKEELALGNTLFCDMFHAGIKAEDVTDFAKTDEAEPFYARMDCTKEAGIRCINLADHWQTYSDWYKYIWNIRPTF